MTRPCKLPMIGGIRKKTKRQGRSTTMWHIRAAVFALGVALLASALTGGQAYAQAAGDPNAAPNPYRLDEGWAKLPEGRKWGGVFGISIDRDGKSVWAFDRCESTLCGDSNLAPIFKFDPT